MEWRAGLDDGVPFAISVNASSRQIARPGFAASVARILEETGMGPSRVSIEMTETALIEDSEASSETLSALKDLGVRIVLDDFGTGYSSLGYLDRYPIDALKIDRKFVAGIGRESKDTAIVAASLNLAQALGIGVIAEGVETAEQCAFLVEHGCELAQGFYFSPLSPRTSSGPFSRPRARRPASLPAPELAGRRRLSEAASQSWRWGEFEFGSTMPAGR